MSRLKVATISPRWFLPMVRMVTMPWPGLDLDSRLANTSLSPYRVSPANTGAVKRTSSMPRLATAFCEQSLTLMPISRARV